MTSSYEAVLIDLDGTLVRSDETISRRSMRALRAVEARGVIVMITTGRSVISAIDLIRPAGLRSPVCCYNGTVVCDSAGREWFQHLVIDDAVSRDILDRCRATDVGTFVYHRDRKYALATGAPEYRHMVRVLENLTVVADASELPDRLLTRISLMGDAHAVGAEIDGIGADHGDSVNALPYPLNDLPYFRDLSSTWCDIEPSCRGKAEAVAFLQREHGIEAQQIVAIGDQTNDRSMLDAAGLAVAVENAEPTIRELADRVIGHHDEEGVAAFLEELFIDGE